MLANGFQRIVASKSFKKSGSNLCDALATLTRQLCTEYIDPATIESILVSRLIPLDKGNCEVRPFRSGERSQKKYWEMRDKGDETRYTRVEWLASGLRRTPIRQGGGSAYSRTRKLLQWC